MSEPHDRMTRQPATRPAARRSRRSATPPRWPTQIETRWQQRWADEGTFNAPNPTGPLAEGFDRVAIRPHSYIMDMFPYPSGAGLHVGHPLGYIGTDVYARYRRMRGDNVLHTMGFDAFGLPAEQYAVETGQHPRTTTYGNIDVFLAQLRRLGLGHDERRRVATTDPEFYRWTQWIFLQIFNAWYDDRLPTRRVPIAELVAELDAGTAQPAEAGTNPTGRPWAELTELERRQVVDNHRLAYRTESMVNWAPGPGHGAVQRGGHPGRPQRARQLPGVPPPAAAVEHAHHRLRRPPGPRPRPDRLAGQGAHDAAQLDRPLDRRARVVRLAGRRHRGVHHPSGHAVRRDLHGPGTRAPAWSTR